MRHLILPFTAVALGLSVAGCALKFDLQGNYKGVVDPTKLQGRAPGYREADRVLLGMYGFKSDNPYPKYNAIPLEYKRVQR